MSTLIKTLEAYPRLNIFIPLMCIIWEDQLVSPAEQDLMIQYLSTQDWLMEEEKASSSIGYDQALDMNRCLSMI